MIVFRECSGRLVLAGMLDIIDVVTCVVGEKRGIFNDGSEACLGGYL